MKGKIYYSLVAVLLFSMLIPTQLQPVSAQVQEPEITNPFPAEPCIPGKPCQDDEGNWYMNSDFMSDINSLNEIKSTGGPDDFGYTWDNTVAYSWIDAKSGGINTGINNSRSQVGPISLPFEFKFYENSYNQLYITSSGYITFSDQYTQEQQDIPSPALPNNNIAALWMPLSPGILGSIYYKSGGSIDNRYFVIEWNQLTDTGLGGSYTFEIILFESGDIKLQYKNININYEQGYYCASTGIEDSLGLDGLAYPTWCGNYPPSSSAIMFYRPSPSVRVRITPLYQGMFTKPQETNEFLFTVTNTGEMGSDTYDFTLFPGWSPTLHKASNNEPLVDTDMDGIIDTGPLTQGDSLELKLRVVTPDGLTAGASNTVTVTATSSLDYNKSKTARFDLSVPAPFAQIYSGVNNHKVNLDLVWPEIQSSIALTPEWSNSSEPVVAETNDHNFVNVWSNWISQGVSQGWVLQYSIVDKYGNVTIPVTNLTNLDNSTDEYRSDESPSVAVAPDGKIGVTWYRNKYNFSSGLSNYNIWYAILNPSGTIAHGPINLTNNTTWGNWETVGFKQFYNPSIVVTEDNHFLISWQKQQRASSSTWLSEIIYAVLQSSGASILPPTKIESGVAGSLEFYNPSVTSLSGSRFFVTYSKYQIFDSYWTGGSFFRVYNSAGGLIKSETEIQGLYNKITSKQLSGGNILLASPTYGYPSIINYKLVNNTTFESISSSSISHPTMLEYQNGFSVTKDSANRGILTWTDSNRKYLYYALIDANGSVLTEPMIFHSAKPDEFIGLNYYGGSNTTNSWEPISNLDGLVDLSSTIYGVAPGGSAEISVFYANDGLTTATNVKLSLTLDEGLTYNYDTSGITPSIAGNTVEWDLPDLAPLDNDRFMLYLSIPSDAPLGTQYSISFTLSSDGTDSDPENNTFDAIIFSTKHVFLPLIIR